MIRCSLQSGVLLLLITIITLTAPAMAGISVASGDKIVSTTGETSAVITITGTNLAAGQTITVDASLIDPYCVGGITADNVRVSDTAAAATWTGSIDFGSITLTSTGGATAVGETVTLTLTGAHGNAWVSDSGDWTTDLSVLRDDDGSDGLISFWIDTPAASLPGTLSATNGAKITTATGATSPEITIGTTAVPSGGTITINVGSLALYTANETIVPANFQVSDTAAAATWTTSLAGTTLTLTSAGGATAPGEKVTVTFTGGSGNAWLANTSGEQNITLTAIRSDSSLITTFNVVIDTGDASPLPGAAFSVSPETASPPALIRFTDTSTGSPSSWRWDFGDGDTSMLQNPEHTYTVPGTYTVTLMVTNAGGTAGTSRTVVMSASGSLIANTTIDGLTLSYPGGRQKVTVNTAILPAVLTPNSSVLLITPPADRGWSTITIYALDGAGFVSGGGLISGNVTAVHFVTSEVAPAAGFPAVIGTDAAFNTSFNVGSYPAGGLLDLRIQGGAAPDDSAKARIIADSNHLYLTDTAYSVSVTPTGISAPSDVRIRMSIDADWTNTLPGAGANNITFWRIAGDRSGGELFRPELVSYDAASDLNYYEVASPQGYSTFGMASTMGENNVFQFVTFTVSSYVNAAVASAPAPSGSDSSKTGANAKAQAQAAVNQQQKAPPEIQEPPVTAKIFANGQGLITQATTLPSADNLLTLSIGTGIVARDAQGTPLASVSITRLSGSEIPPAGAAFSFAGQAYDLQPDGAVFSPGVTLTFRNPDPKLGTSYVIRTYDDSRSEWVDLPTTYDPSANTYSATVTHFCYMALFARTTDTAAASGVSATPVPTITAKAPPAPPAPTAISTATGIVLWIVNLMLGNILLTAAVIIAGAAGILYYQKQKEQW